MSNKKKESVRATRLRKKIETLRIDVPSQRSLLKVARKRLNRAERAADKARRIESRADFRYIQTQDELETAREELKKELGKKYQCPTCRQPTHNKL